MHIETGCRVRAETPHGKVVGIFNGVHDLLGMEFAEIHRVDLDPKDPNSTVKVFIPVNMIVENYDDEQQTEDQELPESEEDGEEE